MNIKVVSSLAMLLVGFATTAYAGGFYHGDHYYAGNINAAPVSAYTYTKGPDSIYSNKGLDTLARGAELFVNNVGSKKGFGLWNKNFAPVSATTNTVSIYGNVSSNDISTTAVGALTNVQSEGSHNYFFIKNGNWGPVRALTETSAPIGGRVQFNTIITTAIGAQTILGSEGHGNHGLLFNINDGRVRAITNTYTSHPDGEVVGNTIATTAVGAALSIDDTKVSGHHYGRYYRSSNGFGSFNLNLGNVAAQTNTFSNSISGNSISTTAVGASTSITTHTIRGHR